MLVSRYPGKMHAHYTMCAFQVLSRMKKKITSFSTERKVKHLNELLLGKISTLVKE